MTSVLCFVLFLLLGAVASVQDWREKKIRNRLIVSGLAACAAVLALLFLNSLLGHRHLRLWRLGEYYLPWRYYPKVLLHGLLSFAAAFGLWRASIWPAGDAKLFTLFAVLAVLIDPNLPGFPAFLFLLLLINIFVPAGLVFAAETLVKMALKLPALRGMDWSTWLKAKFDVAGIRLREAWPYRVEYLVLAVNLFALFLGLQAAQARVIRGLGEPLRSLTVFLFMFVFWSWLVSVLRNKKAGLAALAGIFAWTMAGSLYWRWDIAGRAWSTMKMMLNFGMFLSTGRFLLDWFIEKESLRELRADQLQLGSVLSDRTWERLAAEKELDGKMSKRCVDGLTEEDASALKAWLAGRGAADYTVYQTIPFALWITLGALLTMSGRANVVSVLAPVYVRAQGLILAAAARWFS